MTIKLPARRNFLKGGVAAALGAAAFPLLSSSSLATKAALPTVSATPPQTSAPAVTARIKIDFDRQIGKIDRNIYGNFIEHLGRCIYGGIYEEGSPLSDSDGFRKDVLEAVRGLHIPLAAMARRKFFVRIQIGATASDQKIPARAAGTLPGRPKNPIASAPTNLFNIAASSAPSLTSPSIWAPAPCKTPRTGWNTATAP